MCAPTGTCLMGCYTVTTGINPYAGPDIRITRFKTIRLGKEKIGIVMNLQDPETGLERQIALSLLLSNGSVAL